MWETSRWRPSWATWQRGTEPRGRVDFRAVRREAEEVVAAMPIPRPFDLEQFLQAVERQTGRDLLISPAPDALLSVGGREGLTGIVWRSTSHDLDVCLYQVSAPALQRQKVILSQVAHLWCAGPPTARRSQPGVPGELAARLGASGQVIVRGPYDTHESARAETIANLIQCGALTSALAAHPAAA